MLRLKPDRPDRLYGLGFALAEQGDLAAAEHALKRPRRRNIACRLRISAWAWR
jgi:hypothetical protein